MNKLCSSHNNNKLVVLVQALREQATQQEYHLQEEAVRAGRAEGRGGRVDAHRGHPQPAQPPHQPAAGQS